MSLKILHILRAPVGGLFRHVVDLAEGQSARGHRVGMIIASGSGGVRTDDILLGLRSKLALGIARVAMPRHLSPMDIVAANRVSRTIAETAPDVIHGHGAKGAAYMRLASTPKMKVLRVYTPHGGSLHYGRSLIGLMYLTIERILMGCTGLILFDSAFGRDSYFAKVGTPPCPVRVIPNGVASAEFEPVSTDSSASDVLFVGELRALKGVDLLIKAVGKLVRSGRQVNATIIGNGPDAPALLKSSRELLPAGSISFLEAMPARKAFARGRLMVVPSRAESLPYIVLEAAAAGIPIVATRVGGIPEIFGPFAARLVTPMSSDSLAEGIAAALDDWPSTIEAARKLQSHIRHRFSQDAMVDRVLEAYLAALPMQEPQQPTQRMKGAEIAG